MQSPVIIRGSSMMGCLLAAACGLSILWSQETSPSTARPREPLLPAGPSQQDYPHLNNLLRAAERIYTGGQPQGEQALADLAALGVRTLVSVDAMRPDTAAAAEYGLRYVHIPIGYDGISLEAGRAIARVVRDTDGALYIHCHHGKHRGPAAAAVACIAAGLTDGQSAAAVLHKAGTSPGYAGLWRDVTAYVPPAADDPLPELAEAADVGSLAAAMVQIDRALDNVILTHAQRWIPPVDHPDITAAQQALVLKETYHETIRLLELDNPYDVRFLVWMKQAEQNAANLQAALEQDNAVAAAIFFSATQSECRRCHKQYRD